MKALKLFFITISIFSCYLTTAQVNQAKLRSVVFYQIVKASDTTEVVANDGRMWQDKTTGGLRMNVNGTNVTVGGGGGGGGITGTLTSGRIPYATGTSTVSDDSNLTWQAGPNILTIGTLGGNGSIISASDLAVIGSSSTTQVNQDGISTTGGNQTIDSSGGDMFLIGSNDVSIQPTGNIRLTTSSSIGNVWTASGTNGTGGWAAPSGGIGGSTGATDNAILRADGTGGSTVQSSSLTIDDSGNMIMGTVSLGGDRGLSAINSTSNANFNLSAQGVINLAFSNQSTKFFGTSVSSNTVHAMAMGNNASGPAVGGLITINNDGSGSVKGGNLYFVSGTPGSGNNNGGDLYFKPGDGVGSGLDGNVGFFTTSVADWQDMEKGIAITNATTAPTDGIANGVALWSEDLNSSSELYTMPEAGVKINLSGLVQPIVLSGTTLTLDETYRGKMIYATNAGAVTITIPAGLQEGFNCLILQDGTGTVTLNAAAVTLVGKSATASQHDAIGLVLYKATDTYWGR